MRATSKNAGYKFSLWLLGDGPLLSDLKRYAEELQITDCVTFLVSKAIRMLTFRKQMHIYALLQRRVFNYMY